MELNILPENRFYVYHHIVKENFTLDGKEYKVGDVVYVGSGTQRRFNSTLERIDKHMKVWHLLDKVIVVSGLNIDEKIKVEQAHIDKYGGLLFNVHRPFKPKHIDYATASNLFVIDNKSPTGLSHAVTSHVKHKIGKPAGTLKEHTGYAYVKMNHSLFLTHRVIWCLHNRKDLTGEFLVDHIDGNRRNNRPENLRLATHQTNHFNKRIQRNNVSGMPGIDWVVRNTREFWRARLTVSAREISKTFNPKKLYPDIEYEEAVEKAKQDCMNWRSEMVNKFYKYLEDV